MLRTVPDDDRGQTASVTSYDSAAARHVVNQIAYQRDGWGNVTQSAQAHSGPATSGTPAVGYTYDAALERLTSVSYPTTRTVGYRCGDSGTADSRLARVSAITDGSTTTYVAYTRL